MSQTEILKLDVRVRDRLLSRRALSADELEQHLSSLPDLESAAEALDLQQPALGQLESGTTAPIPSMVGAEAGSDEDLEAP